MSGAQITAEVDAALKSLGPEIGAGSFTIQLIRPTFRAENPWDQGLHTAPEPITIAGNVENYPRNMIDGTLILASDRRVMLSATSGAPNTDDKLLIGGVRYNIVAVDEFAPQGVALFYIVQARV